MVFFIFSWKDARRKSTLVKSARAKANDHVVMPSPAPTLYRSNILCHDSAYGGSNISSTNATISEVSAISSQGSSNVGSRPSNDRNNNGRNSCSSPSSAPLIAHSRHLTYNHHMSSFSSCPVGMGPVVVAPKPPVPLTSDTGSGTPSNSFTRFRAALSQLLPRQKSKKKGRYHHDHIHNHNRYPHSQNLSPLASTVSTASFPGDADRNQLSISKLFQRCLPRPLTTRKGAGAGVGKGTTTDSFGSTSVRPLCMHPISPISTASPKTYSSMLGLHPLIAAAVPNVDVAAPACFPGKGAVGLATKQQQLLELQQSSKRPCASSTRPTLQTTMATTMPSMIAPSMLQGIGKTRHLAPHHHPGVNGSAACSIQQQQLQQDPWPCGDTCPPLSSSSSTSSYMSLFLPFRQPLVGSLSMSLPCPLAPGSTCYPPTKLLSPRGRRTVSNWTTDPNEDGYRHLSISGRSMNEMKVVATEAKALAKSAGYDPFPRRRSTQSSPSSFEFNPSTLGNKTPTTKKTFGQGYDISTMFKVGPLPPVSSSQVPS
ncbi:hypothetical protein EDD21DRAFT_436730 [Dissophora ornata]|nr:hypothetical protein EDD21DRAFT_436730 [Dissophora ornata]